MPVYVLHTHSVAGCAVSMQKDGLLPLNKDALQVIGDVAYHDYEGTSRNPEERARFFTNLGDRRIMVLRNHGLWICRCAWTTQRRRPQLHRANISKH
jgi:ribulose-5-phosphate 4-epimerase/fuculose-1-phosphate aldolase